MPDPSRTGHSTSEFTRPRSAARHVWVGTQPHPGVLVEWRQEDGVWLAQVVYVEGARMVVAWLPAEMVRPA